MRGLVLLATATLGAAFSLAAPVQAQTQTWAQNKAEPTALPAQSAAAAAEVRAGVDAWTSGNYEAAVKAWQDPAARGDADALFNLGQAYKLGRGVTKDMTKAEAMYGKAARLGHVRAGDNYGLLLFQTNRQQAAMPWLQSAADRGEPRAMYVLGVASYNGDYAPKDWVRAYALISRAAATGLPQAVTSLATMNETIPLAQRQMGVSLASELDQKAADTRGRELAAADLGISGGPTQPTPPRPVSPTPAPAPLPTATPIERVDLPPSAPVTADGTGIEEPAPEDQSYAAATPRPATPAAQPPRQTAPKPTVSKPAAAKPAADSGPWRVQLGAFGMKSNADAMWARVRGRPEIAGHARADVGSPVARLLATGYSQAGAQRACAALKAGGFACLVTSH
jgi:hypothetical protein